MAEISRFFGIVIAMYYREHVPPHFHAYYGEHSAQISIEDLRIIEGELPNRVRGLVLEWADPHREELMKNWNAMQQKKPFIKIEPLAP